MYEYKAKLVRIYDADTLWCDIDLGFSVWMANQTIRLYGINAWELRSEEKIKGALARDAFKELLPDGSFFTLRSYKDSKGKYGRWLGEIILDDGTNINQWLVEQGHAVTADY